MQHLSDMQGYAPRASVTPRPWETLYEKYDSVSRYVRIIFGEIRHPVFQKTPSDFQEGLKGTLQKYMRKAREDAYKSNNQQDIHRFLGLQRQINSVLGF